MDWKKIKEYDYIISKQGKIRRLMKNGYQIPVKIFTKKNGYEFVYLWKNDIKKTFYVHRLVAKAWLSNKNKMKYHVDHINRIRNDNRIENLKWATPKENNLNRGFDLNR